MSLFASFFGRELPLTDQPTPRGSDGGSSLLSSQTDEWAIKSGAAVSDSRDLRRILELPTKKAFDENLIEVYTQRLSRPNIACECQSKFRRPCVKRLKASQAQALHEISDGEDRNGKAAGLFAPIAVGGGKTLLDMLAPLVVPECRRAVLLIPPNLRDQLLGFDWEFYSQHWRLPNRAGGRWFTPGLPTVHVVAYSELSSPKATDLLERLQPDTIIADEGHFLRNHNAARTKRFLRYFKAHPSTRFLVWSGTLTAKSIRDFAHLAELGLGEGSPLPTHYPTVVEWAEALDPSDWPRPPGALVKLCRPGETVRDGIRRRILQTKGVVASGSEDECQASLVISSRDPGLVPDSVSAALRSVERSWTRPDGEELTDALTFTSVMRQLSYGFYYRWIYPHGEPKELIDEWFNRRQEWHRELRQKLKHPKVHLDSPLLCTKAAIRYYEGVDGRTREGKKVARGELPVWNAEYWPGWRDIRRRVQPETDTVWLSPWLAEDAAAWARDTSDGTGIVWYKFDAFGQAVGRLAEVPCYGGGDEASRAILTERGTRSIVASIAAHGTGKNLQHSWARNLISNVSPSGTEFEQLIGRTHRPGQAADEVTVELYQHTEQLVEALEKAREGERFVEATLGTGRKLNLATYIGI